MWLPIFCKGVWTGGYEGPTVSLFFYCTFNFRGVGVNVIEASATVNHSDLIHFAREIDTRRKTGEKGKEAGQYAHAGKGKNGIGNVCV